MMICLAAARSMNEQVMGVLAALFFLLGGLLLIVGLLVLAMLALCPILWWVRRRRGIPEPTWVERTAVRYLLTLPLLALFVATAFLPVAIEAVVVRVGFRKAVHPSTALTTLIGGLSTRDRIKLGWTVVRRAGNPLGNLGSVFANLASFKSSRYTRWSIAIFGALSGLAEGATLLFALGVSLVVFGDLLAAVWRMLLMPLQREFSLRAMFSVIGGWFVRMFWMLLLGSLVLGLTGAVLGVLVYGANLIALGLFMQQALALAEAAVREPVSPFLVFTAGATFALMLAEVWGLMMLATLAAAGQARRLIRERLRPREERRALRLWPTLRAGVPLLLRAALVMTAASLLCCIGVNAMPGDPGLLFASFCQLILFNRWLRRLGDFETAGWLARQARPWADEVEAAPPWVHRRTARRAARTRRREAARSARLEAARDAASDASGGPAD